MKMRAFLMLFSFLCAFGATAGDSKTSRKSEDESRAPSSLPNVKQPASALANRKPSTTLNQVERQTGGKVIGAKPVTVQGRQLNLLKVRLPNGQIVMHEQLFDENGRSVDTVQDEEKNPDNRTKAADH